jgi:putative flippase GtrA
MRTWTVTSAFDATIRYVEEVAADGPDELNYKPPVALIFAILLLLIGSYVSNKNPLKFKDDKARNRFFTFFTVVLPFVMAELATGVVSFLTGALSVPPLLGAGMAVDLGILLAGVIVFLFVGRRKAGSGDSTAHDSESDMTSED